MFRNVLKSVRKYGIISHITRPNSANIKMTKSESILSNNIKSNNTTQNNIISNTNKCYKDYYIDHIEGMTSFFTNVKNENRTLYLKNFKYLFSGFVVASVSYGFYVMNKNAKQTEKYTVRNMIGENIGKKFGDRIVIYEDYSYSSIQKYQSPMVLKNIMSGFAISMFYPITLPIVFLCGVIDCINRLSSKKIEI